MPIVGLGDSVQSRILKTESHKLHHEFTVKAANSVRQGMLVKLHTDGTVEPVDAADTNNLAIGYCLQDAAAGEYVTVVCRGYAIIFAESQGALNAGPVEYDDFGSGSYDLPEFIAATDTTDYVGWAIDSASGANEIIRVLVNC